LLLKTAQIGELREKQDEPSSPKGLKSAAIPGATSTHRRFGCGFQRLLKSLMATTLHARADALTKETQARIRLKTARTIPTEQIGGARGANSQAPRKKASPRDKTRMAGHARGIKDTRILALRFEPTNRDCGTGASRLRARSDVSLLILKTAIKLGKNVVRNESN